MKVHNITCHINSMDISYTVISLEQTQQHFTSLFALTCPTCQSVRKVKIWTVIPAAGELLAPLSTAKRELAHIVSQSQKCFGVIADVGREIEREMRAASRTDPGRQRQTSAPSASGRSPRIFTQMKFEPCYYYAIPQNLCKRAAEWATLKRTHSFVCSGKNF